jgi:hypothetical protein
MRPIEPGARPGPPIQELFVVAPRCEGGNAHRNCSRLLTPRRHHRFKRASPIGNLLWPSFAAYLFGRIRAWWSHGGSMGFRP